jgi:hypothetical protein
MGQGVFSESEVTRILLSEFYKDIQAVGEERAWEDFGSVDQSRSVKNALLGRVMRRLMELKGERLSAVEMRWAVVVFDHIADSHGKPSGLSHEPGLETS